MAVYTDISDEELNALLSDFDLGAPLAFKGIAEGVENSNFLLETEAGQFILTVYEKRVREDELPFFLGLTRWLAQHDYPSATPMIDKAGEALKRVRGKPCAIFSFLPGLAVRRPTAAHCREAGEGLARLHLAGEGFSMSRANDLGQAAWAPMFDALKPAAEALKPGLSKVIDGDLQRLAAAWPADLPGGAIHADYFPDNVLFENGAVSAVIDFYFGCDGAFAYDLAIALSAWGFDAEGRAQPQALAAFQRGYEAVRPLSAVERAALPRLGEAAALRFTATRLHDRIFHDPANLVTPKVPVVFLRRLDHWRAVEPA